MTQHCRQSGKFYSIIILYPNRIQLLLLTPQLYILELLKYVIVEDLDVGALHSGRTRLDDPRALELAKRIDDDRAGDSDSVGDLAGYKDSLAAAQLIKDVNDGLELGEGKR